MEDYIYIYNNLLGIHICEGIAVLGSIGLIYLYLEGDMRVTQITKCIKNTKKKQKNNDKIEGDAKHNPKGMGVKQEHEPINSSKAKFIMIIVPK